MKEVFSGGDGVIYAINTAGDLLWFRHEGQGDGTFRWADNNARKVGTGWNFKHVFSGGSGIIYAVLLPAIALVSARRPRRRQLPLDRCQRPQSRCGLEFSERFLGGDGAIYAISANGDLLWFRHDGMDDGSFRWADTNARKVGAGWNLKKAFSGGEGVIYAVAQNDDLLWFRHNGRLDGSFTWGRQQRSQSGDRMEIR